MFLDITTERIATPTMAREFLGVSRQTIHAWRKMGILPEYRYGSTVRVCFKWDDLVKLKESRTKGAEK